MSGDPLQAFLEALARAGLTPETPGKIRGTGQIERFRVVGDKRATVNGWCILFLDGQPAGAYGSWKTGESHTWRMDSDKPFDPAQAAAFAKQMAVAREHRDRERAKAQAKAAQDAAQLLAGAYRAPHDYLARKGFPEHVGLIEDIAGLPTLLVPMRTATKLVGIQKIAPDGTKRFLFGQQTSDATYEIGLGKKQVLCEGYATGLSLRAAVAALKIPAIVVCCFSASNLTRVALNRPGCVVVADNDQSGTGEAAARATGRKFWTPPVIGHDANDFHKSRGLFALTQEIRPLLMH